MSMRKGIKRELHMLRIVAHHFLPLHTCMFCATALMTEDDFRETGGRTSHPVSVNVTIHHVDGDASNNSPSNKAAVHRTCHKRFHMTVNQFVKKGKTEKQAFTLAMKSVRKQK